MEVKLPCAEILGYVRPNDSCLFLCVCVFVCCGSCVCGQCGWKVSLLKCLLPDLPGWGQWYSGFSVSSPPITHPTPPLPDNDLALLLYLRLCLPSSHSLSVSVSVFFNSIPVPSHFPLHANTNISCSTSVPVSFSSLSVPFSTSVPIKKKKKKEIVFSFPSVSLVLSRGGVWWSRWRFHRE